jgi:hypothetical protein
MAPWFGPKTTGYGVGPRTWQGWLACAAALAIMLGASLVLKHVPSVPRWIPLSVFVLTLAALIGLVSAKTGP